MVRMTSREYQAIVKHVVDGDTLDLKFVLRPATDLGFHIIDGPTYFEARVRLRGIDTPEIYGVKKHSQEWRAGLKASSFVKDLLPIGKLITVVTHKTGKYGRYICDVKLPTPDNRDLASVLVKSGHARWKDYD